jgi:hypothetical protein
LFSDELFHLKLLLLLLSCSVSFGTGDLQVRIIISLYIPSLLRNFLKFIQYKLAGLKLFMTPTVTALRHFIIKANGGSLQFQFASGSAFEACLGMV